MHYQNKHVIEFFVHADCPNDYDSCPIPGRMLSHVMTNHSRFVYSFSSSLFLYAFVTFFVCVFFVSILLKHAEKNRNNKITSYAYNEQFKRVKTINGSSDGGMRATRPNLCLAVIRWYFKCVRHGVEAKNQYMECLLYMTSLWHF